MSSAPATNRAERQVRLLGANWEFFNDTTSPELLISSAAGTGKTRAGLTKLHFLLQKYPGGRALLARKTRKSLTESALVTFEHVLGDHRRAFSRAHRNQRASYDYPNGSTLIVGGMDDPAKILSTDFDLVYLVEAVEFVEDDWETLISRLRNNRLPFQQILADTNPGAPTHWLKRRCDEGRCRILYGRHEDNPALHTGTDWTPAGRDYLARLDALTGARRLRLRFGRWVQAEGVVYPDWDPTVHIVDPFPVPPDWPRYWSIDFGYVHPFVCQFWAEDPDGRLYLYREVYRTGLLVEDAAREVRRLSHGEPRPAAVVCDHDREDRMTFEKHSGMVTVPARKAVDAGIQQVGERLRKTGPDAAGRPRLALFRDCTVSPDRSLRGAGRPWRTQDEFDGYVWDDAKLKERPVKAEDDGMDALRYVCAYRGLRVEVRIY